MVRRAPFPRRSLPANIELFNEAIVCVKAKSKRDLQVTHLQQHLWLLKKNESERKIKNTVT